MSTISVIISVCDQEYPHYLHRALKSIWTDQTKKPDQIVLVKDGPLNHDLDKVVAEWKEKLADKLTVLANAENMGLTKSLNLALDHANGDYVARMDSDDISMPDRFSHQGTYLDKHADIDILGGKIQEFNHLDDCLTVRKYPQTHEEVLKYIFKASPLAHPTVMMRRRIFDDGLRYDERYRTSQDIALWYTAILHGYRIANLDEITLWFRREEEVFKRRSHEKARNELMIYMNGIHRLYGTVTPKYIYPLARYVFRRMPLGLIKSIYNSKLRQKVLE